MVCEIGGRCKEDPFTVISRTICGVETPMAASAEVFICGQRTAQSELSSHFGIHRAPAEAADIEIKIKTRLKWRQMIFLRPGQMAYSE